MSNITAMGVLLPAQQPLCTINTIPRAGHVYIKAEMRLPVGVIAQWQSIGIESRRPWVQIPAAPPFFPALSLFQRSTDVRAQLVSL